MRRLRETHPVIVVAVEVVAAVVATATSPIKEETGLRLPLAREAVPNLTTRGERKVPQRREMKTRETELPRRILILTHGYTSSNTVLGPHLTTLSSL
jgi:hypothetical protein